MSGRGPAVDSTSVAFLFWEPMTTKNLAQLGPVSVPCSVNSFMKDKVEKNRLSAIELVTFMHTLLGMLLNPSILRMEAIIMGRNQGKRDRARSRLIK